MPVSFDLRGLIFLYHLSVLDPFCICVLGTNFSLLGLFGTQQNS